MTQDIYDSGLTRMPRTPEDILYDNKFHALKRQALSEIVQSIHQLNTRQKEELDTILHCLISNTIVACGGSLVPWRERAK